MSQFDFIVVGGGTAGMPAAIRAAESGMRVLLLDKSDNLGGTLPFAREMSAAGARQQKSQGIDDHPDRHMLEVQRLAKGEENPALLRLAVDNAADTIDWLESLGVELEEDTPKIVFNHEPYEVPRTYFAQGGGKAVVQALRDRLSELIDAGAVTVMLGHEVVGLCAENGVVAGVTYSDTDGVENAAFAPAVLLSTGGYASSQKLYKEFHGVPQIMAWAPAHATGDGLHLGSQVGAQIIGADSFNLSFGGVLEGDGPDRAILCRLNTLPQFRLPWEIIVNTRGERFVREDEPSIDAQEAALMQQPHYRGFMVFDEHMRRCAPDRMRKWYIADAQEDFEALDWFFCADTLAELAVNAGIDPAGLEQTVTAYNREQTCGQDTLGREYMPVPIGDGPYYAIRFEGCNVISAAGLRSDASLQALRHDGSRIEGLYLAGEILGHGQIMGRSAAGGMMATPAMTFGRLIGEHVARGKRLEGSGSDNPNLERMEQ